MRRWLLLTRNRGMGGLLYPLVLTALLVGTGSALAEAPSWSYQEPAVPNEVLGGESSYALLEDVSCTSSTACTAVGEFGNTSFKTFLLAEGWNGTKWQTQEVPTPTGAKSYHLHGVSCTSSTACTAVGVFQTSKLVEEPLAERWNGTSWSIQEPPKPKGASFIVLYSVSCASSMECMAVGYFLNGSEKAVPLAERWNGTSWSIQEPPTPKGAIFSDLSHLSCTSSTACIAIGFFQPSPGVDVPYSEAWNGTSWSVKETAKPAESEYVILSGVSCTSSTACTVVGQFENASKERVPLAERWNGTTWSVQEPPNPTGVKYGHLTGVSCVSSTSCIAIGSFETLEPEYERLPLAESWNGTTWSVQEPPVPTGALLGELPNMSCTSSAECTAIGWISKGSPSIPLPFAERYQ